MFEKEAEEKYCKGCKSRIEQCLWAWRNTNGLNELKNCSCKEVPNYIRGAEFGYNKANEWHYVSKEGHPNKDDIYLTIRKDGLHLGDYCQGGDGDIDCQSWCDYPSEEEIQDDSIIAWKEIVLPELPGGIKNV